MLPPTAHNIILNELDFDIKFTLLRLLQFLSDLKSTIICYSIVYLSPLFSNQKWVKKGKLNKQWCT